MCVLTSETIHTSISANIVCSNINWLPEKKWDFKVKFSAKEMNYKGQVFKEYLSFLSIALCDRIKFRIWFCILLFEWGRHIEDN